MRNSNNSGDYMKNKLTFISAIILLLTLALGCSLGGLFGGGSESGGDSSSPKESSTKKGEATPSGEIVKIGIPECDELATYINDNSEKIEGSIVARGIVYIYKNWIIENVKEGVEKMNDEEKAKAAKVCAKSLEDLKKSVEE